MNGQQNQAGKQQVNQEDQQDQSVQPTIDASQVNKQRQVTPELGDLRRKSHILQ